jgi:hypothetical protein
MVLILLDYFLSGFNCLYIGIMKRLNWKVNNQGVNVYINLTPSDLKWLLVNHIWASTIMLDTSNGKLYSFPSKVRDYLEKMKL